MNQACPSLKLKLNAQVDLYGFRRESRSTSSNEANNKSFDFRSTCLLSVTAVSRLEEGGNRKKQKKQGVGFSTLLS